MAPAAEEALVDVTDLVRRCASRCLSSARPFAPPAADGAALLGRARKNGDGAGDGLAGGMEGLQIQGAPTNDAKGSDANGGVGGAGSVKDLDLLDAMTALELGDDRMDCCEIPVVHTSNNPSSGDADPENDPKPPLDPSSTTTYPPRIAPTSLSDGTPCVSPSAPNTSHASQNLPATTLLLPSSPCPSLLPHWDALSISSHSLLSLLLLQITALEAYIGTNNGGSSAAETLYSMLWLHDRVLRDMSERLGVNFADPVGDVEKEVENLETRDGEYSMEVDDQGGHTLKGGAKAIVADERTVARWILFASSLGTVRIAEAVRWAVVNADFYEEEDFGVAMHGDKAAGELGGVNSIEDGETTEEGDADGVAATPSTESDTGSTNQIGDTTMKFCPALEGSQYIEVIWDTALSYLHLYRTTCISKEMDMDSLDPVIGAVESILKWQQCFFQAVKTLSNLSDETVCDFAKIAVKRSREAVSLLDGLRDNAAVADISTEGLVGIDGRVMQETNPLLSASFDPFVNRRLQGNAPVRKACFRSPLKVLTSLSELSSELEWGVCEPLLYGDTFGRITRMLERSSLRGCGGVVPKATPKKEEKSGKKDEVDTEAPFGVNILARSLLVLNLYFDDKLLGQYDFPQMIVLVEQKVPRNRGFTESIVLPAFKQLQYVAAVVDEKFKEEHELDPRTTPSYATNYVILNTIRLMERHVGLGIELKLYPNYYDLSTAIWYRDFLLSAMINVRGTIEQERIERKKMDLRIKMEEEEAERKAKAQAQQQQQQSKKKGKSKKGNKSKQSKPEPVAQAPNAELGRKLAEDLEDRIEYTTLMLRRSMCRGLVRYIAALRQAEMLPEPPATATMFTTHETRFERRFEAFGSLPQPPPLSYEDYVRGSDFSAVQSKDLLFSAKECFRAGKSIVDSLLDVIVTEGCEDNTINGAKRKDDDLYVPIRREEIMALAKAGSQSNLQQYSVQGGKAPPVLAARFPISGEDAFPFRFQLTANDVTQEGASFGLESAESTKPYWWEKETLVVSARLDSDGVAATRDPQDLVGRGVGRVLSGDDIVVQLEGRGLFGKAVTNKK
ncbi:hypothetical protein ACHAXT_011643 [Thalassiosira profunda]